MPEKITLPVPLDRWFADDKRISELREILESTTLQEAIATLKEVAGPSYGTITVSDDDSRARHAWYAGYRDAFNDLHKLTKFKNKTPKQIDEWTHIHPTQ
jgi:hypothetical protein